MKKLILIFLVLFSFDKSKIVAQEIDPYFTAVLVKNIDTSIAWYTSVLNLKVQNKMESAERGFRQANLSNGKLLIELIELKNSITPDKLLENQNEKPMITGLFKTGFKVTDIESLFNNLRKKEVTFRGSLVTDQQTGKKMFIILDPDKNYLQFFEK